MARVVVVGSINMDVVARAPRHPTVGETVLGTTLALVPGGKGANQAVAASRLGAPTELVGRLGTDAFGDILLDFLAAEKMGLEGVRRVNGVATGTALIVVGDGGDNTIVVVPGANHGLTTADVEDMPVEPGDVVVVQYELPLEVVHAVLTRARRNGARTVLNPAPAQPSRPELLALADFVVLNEGELALLCGADEVIPGLRSLRRRPQQVLVATLGAHGAIALVGDHVVAVPGLDVPAVDTTGAGDCFVGALAASLCSWADVEEAVHFANLAASLAVQRAGAGTGMPYLADVEALA